MGSRIIIKDRILIPKKLIPKKVIHKRYHVQLFDQHTCNKCEVFKEGERPNDVCETCPAFLANYKLYKEKEKHWSVPQGDLVSLTRLLDKKGIEYTVDDRREEFPFKFPIKWTGKLFGKDYIDENGLPRINQKALTKEYLKTGEGLLRALPRAGKTVMAINMAIRQGNRFIVMANRKELLKQFYNTMVGWPDRPDRKPVTNIPELREETGKEIIRLVTDTKKGLTKLKNVDILLINYQKGIHDAERIKNLIDKYGYSLLIVDEAHGAGAESYLRIVASANVKRRMGLTATPRRKDKRHVLIERIMGMVVAESKSSSLIPNIRCHVVPAKPPSQYKMWPYAIKWLTNSEPCLEDIVKNVFKDLRAGHEVILIPVDYKNHLQKIVKAINEQAKLNRKKRKEDWPDDLAVAYHDGVDRDSVLRKVDDKNPTVLVAIRSMIKEGIDFLRPSCMHIVIPMSSSKDEKTGAPMFFQLSNRVCTPYKKPPPIIRIYIYDVGMFKGATSGLMFKEILPNSKPKDGDGPRYILEDVEYEKFKLALKRDAPNRDKVGNMRSWV